MEKKYIAEIINRSPRPRSKRLREQGIGGIAKGNTVVSAGSSGDYHIHSNKIALDQISTDEDGYLHLTQTHEEDGADITATNKVKAGFADLAQNAALADLAKDLTEDSPTAKLIKGIMSNFIPMVKNANDIAESTWSAISDGTPLFAVKSVKGFYSDDFLSARGLNPWQNQGKVGIDEKELAQYLVNNNYAKKSDIPSLAGYALKSDIPSLANYALKSDIPSLAGYLTKSDADAAYQPKGNYLKAHQDIYTLTFISGSFTAKEYTPNSAVQTVSIPTTTSHISEGSRLYFTDARAQNALASTVTAINNDIALKLDATTFNTFKSDYDSWKSIVDTFMTMFTLEGSGTNRKIKANFGLYTEQFLSARGLNTQGAGGGNFGLMRSWPTSAPSANTTDALGANLGWELKQRIDNLPTTSANPHALTIQKNGTNVAVYDGSAVKTANITIAWSDTASGRPSWIGSTKPSYAWSEITAKPSWIGASKPTYAFSELTSHPTTLAGYGITDAKIADGVITLGTDTIKPLVSHQTIHALTFQSGTFSAKTYTPNSVAQTVNIPTTTSHISEGSRLYFTDARAQNALASTVTGLQSDIDGKVSKDGDTMIGTLTIGIDKASVNHLAFSRTSWNYISATSAGGILVFSTNGTGPSSTGGTLYLEGKNGRPGQNNVGSWGTSSLRWSNLYSVLGNFSGLITASAGIKIGEVTITYDSTNKGLKISGGGVYSESYVSAKGVNSASGGGSSFGRLDDWSKYNAKGTDALSAILGYGLKTDISGLATRITSLEGGSALNVSTTGSGNAVTAVTKSGTVITVTKGSTFLTSHQSLANYLKIDGSNATQAGMSVMMLKLGEATADVNDSTTFVTSHQTPSDANNLFYRRNATHLWNYIKGKADTQYVNVSGDTMTGALKINSTLYVGNTASRRIVMGGASTYSWVDCRDGDDAVKNSIVFYDDKLTAKQYIQAPYFKATGTTLCDNLNADLWDGAHLSDFRMRKYYLLNLSSLSASNFYPVTFAQTDFELDCEIHSPNVSGDSSYNQNYIHFLLAAYGWTDMPKRFTVLQQGNYSNSEITIGSIGYGTKDGYKCVWLRGGRDYRIYSNQAPTLRTSTFSTSHEESYTVGTGISGGTNANITICWTNDSNRSKSTVAMLSDNVASATKLADDSSFTAWGQEFFVNGKPQAISGEISNTGHIKPSADGASDIGSSTLQYRWGFFSWLGHYTGPLKLGAANSTDIYISAEHKVGIGTTAPSEKLHVNGVAKATRLIIGSTSAEKHIEFTRGSYNYITAPASGVIGFLPQGKDLAATDCDLVIDNNLLRPGTTNDVALGSTTYRWKGTYSVLGDFSDTITSSKTTSTHLAGNQGQAIINSTAAAGGYTMLVKMNSTSGYFTQGVYNKEYKLYYTAKTVVDAKTNSTNHQVTLLDEAGLTTVKKLKIGSITLEDVDGNLHINKGVYSDSFVSAKGANTSGSGSGGGVSYNRLDAWGDYATTKADYVLSAKLGYDLYSNKADKSSLANYVTLDTEQTITAKKTFNEDIVFGAEKALRAYEPRKKEGGGGWSYHPLTIRDLSGTEFAHFGVYGSANTLQYIHIGVGAYNTTTHLRISAAGEASAAKFIKFGGTANQFLKADGSVDSNTYLTSHQTINHLVNLGRVSTANVATAADKKVTVLMASTSMTAGKPMSDGYIVNFNWDNTSNWGAQLYIPTHISSNIQWRAQDGTAWNTQKWVNLLDITKLDNATDIQNITRSGLYYGDTDGNSATMTNSPYAQSFAMLTQTCYIADTDVRRARLAFDCNGTMKLFNDRGTSGNAGTWYNVVTSNNYTSIVAKIGTSTVGSTTKPIYLNAGTPTASNATVGSATRPVYISGGTITAGTYTFGNGSGNAPVSNGTVNTNLNADMVDGKHNGELTAIKYGITEVSELDANLYFGDTYNGQMFYGGGSTKWTNLHSDIIDANAKWMWINKISSYSAQLLSATNGRLYYRVGKLDSVGNWNKLAYITDNVASATKLANARTLWGQSFNGTANVSGDMTSVGNITGSGAMIVKANGALTLDSTSEVQIKYNNDGAHSVVLNSSAFKPYVAATNNVDLGASNSVWKNVYARYYTSDTTTYLSSGTSTTSIIFRIGTTEKVRIAQPNGYVGLNNTAPAYRLDVVGDQRLSSSVSGAGGDVSLQLWRGTNTSWKFLNQSGTLKMQCNYTDKIGDYYNCLTVTSNSGNVWAKGDVSTPSCFIRDTYEGAAWNKGYGAYNVALLDNSNQTPFMVAYRSGKSPSATGADRIYAIEMYNNGYQMRFCFGGAAKFFFDSDGVFHAGGGIWSDGYVSARGQNTSSDKRLKRNFKAFEIALQQIAVAPSVSFDWKDGSHDVGSIAQYWQKINPLLTPVGHDGYLTLQYGKTALLSVISVAKKVRSHEERIAELERENKELKRKLELIERR